MDKRLFASTVARVSKTALKIYTCHLLVFTIGVIAGSIQTLLICAALWLR